MGVTSPEYSRLFVEMMEGNYASHAFDRFSLSKTDVQNTMDAGFIITKTRNGIVGIKGTHKGVFTLIIDDTVSLFYCSLTSSSAKTIFTISLFDDGMMNWPKDFGRVQPFLLEFILRTIIPRASISVIK